MSAIGKVASLGAVSLALLGATSGCADNESSLFIIGVLSIDDNECVVTPTPEGPFLFSGTLDLELRDSYTAPLLVGNQLTERGSRNQLRTETSRIRMQGAEVTLEDANGGTIAEFSTLGSGFAHPASGTDPGYGGFLTELIPAGAPVQEGQYVAVVKVFGTTLGGQELESGELRFPIEVCTGCLIAYPPSAQDSNLGPGDGYLCAMNPADALGEGAEGTVGCFPGQDRTVSCILCSSFSDMCRDPNLNPYFQP
jgi:hypothetical protein